MSDRKPYEAVLFDYAGVITERYSEADFPGELAGKFGIETEDFKSFIRETGVMRDLTLGLLTEEEVIQRFSEHFPGSNLITPDEITSRDYAPSSKVLNAIKAMRHTTGTRAYLASNIFPSSVRYLENHNLGGNFDGLFLSCKMGKRKPDENFFEHILDDIGSDPGECLFLDDTLANIETARSLGIVAVHISSQEDVIDAIASV